MRQRILKRLAKVNETLVLHRVPQHLAREAFARFRRTGQLPEDRELAIAVKERVQRGYDLCYSGDQFDRERTIRHAVTVPERKPDPVLDALLHEAVDGAELVRELAREALLMLVARGVDVTASPFADQDLHLPLWGTIGMHLVGLPRSLSIPPHEGQVARLNSRCDELRPRLPQGDEWWFEDLERATTALVHAGELPADALMLEAVLTCGELHCLISLANGADASEALRLFDAAARSHGDERIPAIARIQELATRGGLAFGDDVPEDP